MTDRRGGPKGAARLSDVMQSYLRDSGLERGIDAQQVLLEWEEAVGERVAAVTRPRSISEGTLVVEVRSSPWFMELSMMKARILEELNARLDEERKVVRLVFVLGEIR